MSETRWTGSPREARVSATAARRGLSLASIAVGCCAIVWYVTTSSRIVPPTPGKPSTTCAREALGRPERPAGLLPMNSTSASDVTPDSAAAAP
jgi:hypothetical protein